MKIEDISSGYVINTGNDKRLEPSIVIEKMSDAGIQSFAMSKEKGD